MRKDLHEISKRGKELLKDLITDDDAADSMPPSARSWIDPSSPSESSEDSRFFNKHGFLVKRSFASPSESAEMIDRMTSIVEEQWHPGTSPAAVFRTDAEQESAQGSSDYFLDSADRIHFFSEKGGLKEDGTLATEQVKDTLLLRRGRVALGATLLRVVFSCRRMMKAVSGEPNASHLTQLFVVVCSSRRRSFWLSTRPGTACM